MNPRRAAPTNHNRNEQLRRRWETTLAGCETYEPAPRLPTNRNELQADRDVQACAHLGRAGVRSDLERRTRRRVISVRLGRQVAGNGARRWSAGGFYDIGGREGKWGYQSRGVKAQSPIWPSLYCD